MVPVYAIVSCISFGFYEISVYLFVIRDCYEGFVVASFFNLICQYVSPDQESLLRVLSRKESIPLAPPICCLRGNPSSKYFLSWCKLGIFQYVVVRVSTTIISVVLQSLDLYVPESMNPNDGHFWTTSFNGLSMGVAMFTLITFYIAIHHDILHYKPVLQFLSVKFVIFFSFWQGFFIKLFVKDEYFNDPTTKAEFSTAIQSLLICTEMLIASMLHLWAFDYRIYAGTTFQGIPVQDDQDASFEEPTVEMTFMEALWDSFYWLDIWHDILYAYSFILGRLHRLSGARSPSLARVDSHDELLVHPSAESSPRI
jgi:hypothetical protein